MLPCAALFCFQREPCPIRLGGLKRGCRRSQHAARSRTKYSTVQYRTAWWYSLLTRGQIEQYHRSTTCYGLLCSALLCSLCYGIASRFSSRTPSRAESPRIRRWLAIPVPVLARPPPLMLPVSAATVRRLCFGLQAMEEWKHWRLLLLRDPSLSRRHRGTGTQASPLQN